MEEMESAFTSDSPFTYEGRPVSALGHRLYRLREQIEAAAQRGEVKLLNREEFEHLIADEDVKE